MPARVWMSHPKKKKAQSSLLSRPQGCQVGQRPKTAASASDDEPPEAGLRSGPLDRTVEEPKESEKNMWADSVSFVKYFCTVFCLYLITFLVYICWYFFRSNIFLTRGVIAVQFSSVLAVLQFGAFHCIAVHYGF